VQIPFTVMVRPLPVSTNDDDVVNLVSDSLVSVVSLLERIAAPGTNAASCYTIEFPFQPGDVVNPYAP
jgi:hypothetical protein